MQYNFHSNSSVGLEFCYCVITADSFQPNNLISINHDDETDEPYIDTYNIKAATHMRHLVNIWRMASNV